MHPPTPYPATARTKSRTRDTAFCEITARANAVSKSEPDFASAMKKVEQEVAGKPSKTPNASRRYSVASKFAGPKADIVSAFSSDIAAGEAKTKFKMRTSFNGVPQSNGGSTQVSLASRKSTAAPSKITTNRPGTFSKQATNVGSIPKRQSLVPDQVAKLHKPALDLCKKTFSGSEKAESTRKTHTNKAGEMLLKSARYWLEQVKLAEVMEKHGVSAGFFRLAVECEAEPMGLLREELISYIKRHSLWSNAIRQVLLCYGVPNEAQHTLFSELLASEVTESSAPCSPTKNLEGVLSSERDPAHQVPEKDPKFSDTVDNTIPKGTVEESNMKKEALHSQMILTPVTSGHIESMDADSVTREVVSYIMSSMNHSCSSENLKNDALAGYKDSSMLANSDQSKCVLLEGEKSVLQIRESLLILNSRDPDEAVPPGSPPSLSVWNTLSNEVGIGKLDAQEEVFITLDNDLSDSVSTDKGTGEEMCVSMELDVDETTSDNLSDLQSKSPTYQSAASKGSNCREAQTTVGTHGTVVEALEVNRSSEAISADQNYEELCRDLIHSHDKISQLVQISEKCESGSHKGLKFRSANLDMETEKCTEMQFNCLAESEGNRSRSSFSGRSQNGKEKSTPKRPEIPAQKKYNGAALASQNSRHLSTSTPKSSTSVCVHNIETGSRTRRKSRVSQLAEPGIESNHMHLKSPIVASDGILTTPRQISLDIVEGMDGAITDVLGSMATPGSVGVRRSARLMRPSGVTTMSTPGSVSTCVQRQLQTPMKNEKEVE